MPRPNFGSQTKYPTEVHCQSRNEECYPEQQFRKLSSRHVGARDQPGDHYGDRNGNTLDHTGYHQSVQEGLEDAGFVERGDPEAKLSRGSAAALQARHEQKINRRQHEKASRTRTIVRKTAPGSNQDDERKRFRESDAEFIGEKPIQDCSRESLFPSADLSPIRIDDVSVLARLIHGLSRTLRASYLERFTRHIEFFALVGKAISLPNVF